MRERALQVALVIVGILFLAVIYPLITMHKADVQMLFSVYATLGFFLLMAARNPSANRSLIAFTAWSSFVHGGLMAVQVAYGMIDKVELIGVAVLVIVGVALIALAPAKAEQK